MLRITFFFITFAFFSLKNHAQETPKLKKVKISYQTEIYFATGKNDLRPDAAMLLDSAVFYFKKDTAQKIFLTAHTDSQGSAEANQALALRRSQAVKVFFAEKGIASNKLYSEEFGENNPNASNDNDEGRQKNRRVTVEVSKFVPLVKITGIVKDSVGPVADAWVFLRNPQHKDSTKTNQEGKYQLYGMEKNNAELSVVAKDHFFETQIVKMEIAKLKPLETKLVKSEVGKAVPLKNMFFVGGKPDLVPQSEPTLRDLLLFMQLNPTYKIEIAGHINSPNQPNVPKEHDQYKLSEDRAKTVFEYLVKNHISAQRLKPVGYGNWFMKFPNAKTDFEQHQNRRVEIKILEK